MKCYTPAVKGESVRRTLIALKSQKDKVDSDFEKAKKRVSELKDESEKALMDAKIDEEVAVKAATNHLEIKQKSVEQARVALIKAKDACKRLTNENVELNKWVESTEATVGESSKKIKEEKGTSF